MGRYVISLIPILPNHVAAVSHAQLAYYSGNSDLALEAFELLSSPNTDIKVDCYSLQANTLDRVHF